MISALTGILSRVEDTYVEVDAGAMTFTLLIGSADAEVLRVQRGQPVTFYTVFYLAGDAARGSLEPTLIGFLRPEDREFFNLFTTVKGIGVKTALKALTVPISEIAQAIESRDARTLVKLDGIGKRTAELIVAELSGKAAKFAGVSPGARRLSRDNPPSTSFSVEEERAISRIVAGGDRRSDAEVLLIKIRQAQPELKAASDLWRAMIKSRG